MTHDMTPERYAQVCALFDQARELDPSERAQFLGAACGADASLRTEVERMLAHDQPGQTNFLPTGAFRPDLRSLLSAGDPDDLTAGRRIGPYRIERQIGSGGMGSVYLATRVDDYQHQVALKLIRGGLDTAELVQRFFTERQVLAGLNHAHIARLLDGGTTEDDLPYLVMEYIDGQPITRHCDRYQLPTRARAELLRGVCIAVQHAHQKGVIHRDLKPGNVLVTADGTPKVLDFGLAKVLAVAEVTQEAGDTAKEKASPVGATISGAVLGTPSYMAPEQAVGKSNRIGPAADVYALGAILYELLTGRPPFRSDSPLETLMQVVAEDPVPPSRLHPRLPRDLETICLKCLEKDPQRRYASAQDLADDLGRFLGGESIQARPASWWERGWKWARRRPAAAALWAVSVAAVLALLTISGLYSARLKGERDQARRHKAQAQRNLDAALQAVQEYLLLTSRQGQLGRRDAEGLRQALLAKAVRLCEDLVRQQGNDADVLAVQGRAYLLLALVQTETGNRKEALRLQRQAQAIFDRLARDHPATPQHLDDQAANLNNLGNDHLLKGQWDEAESNFRQAQAIYQQLADAAPANPKYQSDLAGTHNSLGNLHRACGRLLSALASFQQARTIHQRLAARYPTVPRFRNDLGVGHVNLGQLYERLGQFKSALGPYRRAVAVLQALVKQCPEVPEYQGNLARAHLFLGDLYAARDRPDEAEGHLRQALDLYRKLARAHPRVTAYALGLGMACSNRGRFLTHCKKQAGEALAWYDRAVATLEKLLEADPNQADARAVLYGTLVHRADAYGRVERPKDALKDWDRVIKMERGPERDRRRVFRAHTLVQLGEHARAAAEADDLSQGAKVSATDRYSLVAVYSRASALARGDPNLPPADRDQHAERYATRAVTLLKNLAVEGYFNAPDHRQELEAAADLAPLRARVDFQKLVKELEERHKKNGRL